MKYFLKQLLLTFTLMFGGSMFGIGLLNLAFVFIIGAYNAPSIGPWVLQAFSLSLAGSLFLAGVLTFDKQD